MVYFRFPKEFKEDVESEEKIDKVIGNGIEWNREDRNENNNPNIIENIWRVKNEHALSSNSYKEARRENEANRDNISAGDKSLDYTIEVVGEGEVMAIPDKAIVSIGVITDDKNAQKAQSENTRISLEVINSIKNLGVDEKDIQTTTYTIYPVYDYLDGKKVFKGYKVTHTLTVKVDEVEKVGHLVDKAINSGANSVESIEFMVDKSEPYYKEALKRAANDARTKANDVAESLGVKVEGVPLRVCEEVIRIAPLYMKNISALAAGEADVPIQKGEVKVEAAIRVLYKYN